MSNKNLQYGKRALGISQSALQNTHIVAEKAIECKKKQYGGKSYE